MNKATFFCLLFVIMLVFKTHGQGIGRYHFEEFDLAHKAGIPGVYSMFQDTSGVIWFGSTNGIYRYDGARIFEFTAEQKKLLGKTNYSFLQAKNGDVIIGNDYGLCRYSIKYNTVTLLLHLASVFNDLSRYYPLCFDDKDNLWFVASGKGIGMYKNGKVNWMNNPKGITPESITKITDAFYDERSGNLFLAQFYGAQTAIFNIKTHLFIEDSIHKTATFQRTNSTLYRIYSDNVLTSNLISGKTKLFSCQNNAALLENTLYSRSAIIDDEWLWISLRDGVLPFNYRKNTFGTVFGYEKDHRSPLIRHISELFKDKEGNIWICSETDGIKILNRFQLQRFQHVRDPASSNNIIMDIESVNDSMILVCPLVSSPHLVNIFNNSHEPLLSNNTLGGYSFTTARLNASIILLTKHGGETYALNTKNLGLKKILAPVQNFIKIITTSNPNTLIIYHGTTISLYQYENEKLYFLKSLSITNNFSNIIYNPFKNCILFSNQSQCLVVDALKLTILNTQKPQFGTFMDCYWGKDKTLWLATRSGLQHYNTQYKLIESFNTSNGFNNDMIYAIHPNRDSTALYLSTNLGISSFTVATKEIQNYSIADGLMESEHNGGASACDNKGNFFFGNIKGVTIFNEHINKTLARAPYLNIQSISVGDTLYNSNLNPNYIQHIHLYPENDVFGVNFSLLSTSEPAKLVYSYKTEGIDKTFYRSNTAPNIRVSKPRPGNYTLVLRGEIEGGPFVERRILLTVHAPFYLKWWFLIPAILLFHIIVFVIIRRILKTRLRKKQKEIDNERRLYEQKSQIARELHDNVGARLSMMLNTVDWIGKKQQIEVSDLNEIKESTKAVIQGLRDAIWVMDKIQISSEELFDKIKFYTNQIIRNYPVHLTFNEVTHKLLSLNSTQALNLFRIVQESVNNALKYSNATHIEIAMNYEGSLGIMLTIRDNGSGFDPKSIIHGNGLKNMQIRSAEIKATLQIQSIINDGTTITVTLYIV